jgi:hypothetical protein
MTEWESAISALMQDEAGNGGLAIVVSTTVVYDSACHWHSHLKQLSSSSPIPDCLIAA